jgi:hypothetical protein
MGTNSSNQWLHSSPVLNVATHPIDHCHCQFRPGPSSHSRSGGLCSYQMIRKLVKSKCCVGDEWNGEGKATIDACAVHGLVSTDWRCQGSEPHGHGRLAMHVHLIIRERGAFKRNSTTRNCTYSWRLTGACTRTGPKGTGHSQIQTGDQRDW